ncbi:hypothetical protein [Microcoleus sp. B4-D4]|uniref:hypothetical protein n=1 Tax=Microcoleus sp. B4-D4 TaxID=2818667 RepID=UPI002FD4472E
MRAVFHAVSHWELGIGRSEAEGLGIGDWALGGAKRRDWALAKQGISQQLTVNSQQSTVNSQQLTVNSH